MGYNKIQGLGFKNIDQFLDFLPDTELKLVEPLRELILESIPELTEKLSYNVPYYFRNRRVCFIWPASIPWGNVHMEGVMLGICEGVLLTDHEYFRMGQRKRVATRTYQSLHEMDFDLIRYYLFQAVEIDRSYSK